MGFFNALQNQVFNSIGALFGNTATWKQGDNPPQTATVLYKDATEKHGLSDQDYTVERYIMEYKQGVFNGLKDSVAAGNNERVSITTDEGITLDFYVRRIETKYDGKTIIAYLNLI